MCWLDIQCKLILKCEPFKIFMWLKMCLFLFFVVVFVLDKIKSLLVTEQVSVDEIIWQFMNFRTLKFSFNKLLWNCLKYTWTFATSHITSSSSSLVLTREEKSSPSYRFRGWILYWLLTPFDMTFLPGILRKKG